MMNQQTLKSIVTYSDGNLFWKSKRNGINSTNSLGWITDKGYLRCEINSVTYYIHRLVFLYHNGYMPKAIDHIDGNPLNNKIENLRACSQAENMQNYKKPKTNTSGIKNVSWASRQKKWHVRVKSGNKDCHIGFFDSKFEAACAAYSARNKLHGEFCRHV